MVRLLFCYSMRSIKVVNLSFFSIRDLGSRFHILGEYQIEDDCYQEHHGYAILCEYRLDDLWKNMKYFRNLCKTDPGT